MRGIYAIYRNTDNVCIYVGQSKSIEGRVHRHFNRRPIDPNDWHHEVYKNEANYHYIVLEECDANIRGERERYYIEQLKPLYNKTKGGDFVHDEYPESAKEKLRQYKGDNYRGCRKSTTGKIWMTDGYNNIMVENTDSIEQYISKGYKRGQTKRKSLKGYKHSPEVGKKISAKMKGKKRTEEQRKHTSDARKQALKNCRLLYKDKRHAHIKIENISKYLEDGWTFENPNKTNK